MLVFNSKHICYQYHTNTVSLLSFMFSSTIIVLYHILFIYFLFNGHIVTVIFHVSIVFCGICCGFFRGLVLGLLDVLFRRSGGRIVFIVRCLLLLGLSSSISCHCCPPSIISPMKHTLHFFKLS